MYDLNHILYTLISFLITAILLILAKKFVKQQKYKDLIVILSAVVTVAIHYSGLFYDYFKNGSASVEDNLLLPVYPCNIAMWLLLATSLIRNKENKGYKFWAEFTFYLGVIGGTFGIILNANYQSTPDLRNFHIFKGLLSHSTMVFGCLYLLVGNYIKIRVSNTLSAIGAVIIMVLNGYAVIGLFRLCDLTPPNCMFLLENPVPNWPWFNVYGLGALGVAAVFIFTVIVEQIILPKEQRWYVLLKNKINEYRKNH